MTNGRINPYDLNDVAKVDRYKSIEDRTRLPSKDPYITIKHKKESK